MSLYTIFTRYIVAVLLICTLPSCNGLFFKPHHSISHVKSEKTHYTSNDYVKHLALAKLMSEDNEENVDVINAYAAQKAQKPEHLALLVLEYKTDGDTAMQQVAAPISLTGKSTDFPDLLSVMSQLAGNQYTLHNLHISLAKMAPDKALRLPDIGDENLEKILNQQEEHLLKNAAALPLLDNIRIELRLIRFFIEHRFRDAAYLAVDNIKQSLVALPHDRPEDADMVKRFSQELERLESDMRKIMPFSL